MSRTDSYGLGFVGAGFITRESHAMSVQYVPDAHVAGIMNPTAEKAERLADTCREEGCGDPAAYRTVEELVADPAVDGVYVASPNHTRVEAVERIVEAVTQGDADIDGVALEKPLARTLEEARQIRKLVADAGLAHGYLENWGYFPGVERVRDILWREEVTAAGPPHLARAFGEHSGGHSAWFWEVDKMGGGAIMDMMSHTHLATKHLLTDPDDPEAQLTPVAVTGNTFNLKWGRGEYVDQLREEFGVEFGTNPADDYANSVVIYEREDGRPAVAESVASWSYVGAGVHRTLELLGPESTGRIESGESTSNIFISETVGEGSGDLMEKQAAQQGRMPVEPLGVVNGGYVNQTRDVVESFRAGENSRFDLEDGVRTMELCMASYKAAEEGVAVDVQSVDLGEYVPAPVRREFQSGPVLG